jgi:hypothetical protein
MYNDYWGVTKGKKVGGSVSVDFQSNPKPFGEHAPIVARAVVVCSDPHFEQYRNRLSEGACDSHTDAE